jgi:hypothetical protein
MISSEPLALLHEDSTDLLKIFHSKILITSAEGGTKLHGHID